MHGNIHIQYPGGTCITITSKPIPSIAESSKSNHTMGTANMSRIDHDFIQVTHLEVDLGTLVTITLMFFLF